MKKRNFVVIIVIIFFSLFGLLFLSSRYMLNSYHSSYFDVDFEKKWKVVNKGHNYLILEKEKDVIQIVYHSLSDYEFDSKDDLYFSLHKKFLESNPEYRLINSSSSIVGAEYDKGYQYLFESDADNSMLIVCIKKDKVIEVSYTSEIQSFDFGLEDFYDVSNTLRF